jgi:hypothetical protein
MNSRRRQVTISLISILLVSLVLGVSPAAGQTPTTSPPAGLRPQAPTYVTGGPGRIAALAGSPVIRVYQDSLPWFGENRDDDSLLALGKVQGIDYFIHPLSDLAAGIPAGTGVVLITSNGFGLASAAVNQNHPAALANLEAFVRAGGILVVDMGDNLSPGGFLAPGSVGTPDLIFPSPSDATLTSAAAGPDAVLGTADDHPIVLGPDGVPGTADDLTNNNVDMCCHVAHGNLVDGITLPPNASLLMTAPFDGVAKPILAEYCLGAGRVILDTDTKEFSGQQPFNQPPFFMTSLLAYALSPEARCVLPVAVDIKPTSCPNPLNTKSQGVIPVAILGSAGVDVLDIDPASVRLEGVAPLRWAWEDVAAPKAPFQGKTDCNRDCTTAGPDGILDLTFKFDTQQIVPALGALTDGSCRTLHLTGELEDGLRIEGEDVMKILKKKN